MMNFQIHVKMFLLILTIVMILTILGDPFPGPVRFSEKIDSVIVNAVNAAGRRARATLLHRGQ